MAFIPLPNPSELTGIAKELMDDVIARWGYASNLVRAYSYSPKIMEVEDIWSKGVMYEGTLPRAIKEAIATVVSATNEVNYCSSSHAHAYKLAGGDEALGAACRRLEFSDFPKSEQAVLRFAQKATQDAKSITQSDHDELLEYYSPAQIVEIGVVIQQFMGYNAFVTIMGIELEAENPFRR